MPLRRQRRKNLILFDLDGVIVDSRANMAAAWLNVQTELGVTMPFERYFAEIGRPFPDIMVRLGLADQGKAIEAAYRQGSSRLLHDTPFFDGIESLLSSAAGTGVKLGIVTSKDRTRTQLVLDRLAVDFAVVMTPGEPLRGKPAPDHLLYAMATCNCDPSETVFIGDMDSDAEAAQRAGVDYAHVAWGYGAPPARCAISAASPADLYAYLFEQSSSS